MVIGVWRKITQGQGVQRAISSLLEPKLNFPMGATTPCLEGQEHTTVKGHSKGTQHAVLWSFYEGTARGRDGVFRKPLILLPWLFSAMSKPGQ